MLLSAQANAYSPALRSARTRNQTRPLQLSNALSVRHNVQATAPSSRPVRERVVPMKASVEGGNSSTTPVATEAPAASGSTSNAADSAPEEEVFYEGPGSNAELIISLLLLPTLLYAPLSIASIGRRLWISFKFTNKRLTVINTSPLFKRTIEVAYSNIKEIRTGPRGFGLWGDMVIFLRDGSRLEITGLEKYKEIEGHINRCIYTL